MKQPVERRLAAILAADVAGYSRLMGADEEGTLERLKALRRELLDPRIADHHGRIVKTTGDGLLVEFASVIDAVRCAVEVQQAMPERNISVAADNRIELRIGINLGDVIVEGDELFGDGVNIAARVEVLADAGGVFVSNTVYDHVRDRLPFVFEDLGEQQVKNIARPVRVYRVRDAAAKSPALPTLPPDKPSVAVLPFTNMSSRRKQVGRELGVRYVLGGSLCKAGNRIRVTAQLVEGETGKQVCADPRGDVGKREVCVRTVCVKYETVSFLVIPAELHRLSSARRRREWLSFKSPYSRDLRDRSKVLSFSELVRTKRAARLRSPSTQIGAARPGPPYCPALFGYQQLQSRRRLARAPHNGACAQHPEPAAPRSAQSLDEAGQRVCDD
jgi:class 3 adenylate cyclase